MKETSKIILIFVILLFILYLGNASFMMKHFLDYSYLFLTKFVPTSFPFLLFSSILISYGIVDLIPKKSPAVVVLFLSLMSGFPSGAKYTKDLLKEGIITVQEGNKILLFSHFPNPLFVLGSVKAMLSKTLSQALLLTIILSNFLIFLFIKRKDDCISSIKNKEKDFSAILSDSIFSAGKTILLIYGISLFFYTIFVFLTKYLSFSPYFFIFFSGLFDLTSGVFSTSLLSSKIQRAFFILFFLSFGGLSIHIQVKSILEDTPLSYTSFVYGRMIGTILSFSIFSLFLMCGLLQ